VEIACRAINACGREGEKVCHEGMVVRVERDGSPFSGRVERGGCSEVGDVVAWRQQGRV
jgi:hypothetical protein